MKKENKGSRKHGVTSQLSGWLYSLDLCPTHSTSQHDLLLWNITHYNVLQIGYRLNCTHQKFNRTTKMRGWRINCIIWGGGESNSVHIWKNWKIIIKVEKQRNIRSLTSWNVLLITDRALFHPFQVILCLCVDGSSVAFEGNQSFSYQS
jgi:hypothetical protein